MIVKKVALNDVINEIANDTIVYNNETKTYFKKSKEVELEKDYTFKESILGPYKKYARASIQKKLDDGTQIYLDTENEFELLKIFKEFDEFREKMENRMMNIEVEILNNDIVNKIDLNDVEFNLDEYNKHIYVDKNGNDDNDGSKEKPLKTIRKAEEMIEDNTIILIGEGIYDITFGNTNSNKKYCQSGLGSKLNKNVTYQGFGKKTILVVDTRRLNYLSRDITFVNEIKNNNVKIQNIVFKMIDEERVAPNAVSIARNCDGINFNKCVFEFKVKNVNIIYNKIDNNNEIVFNNSIFNILKEKFGEQYDKPIMGKYKIENCYFNKNIKNKIELYDMQNKNFANEITLTNSIGINFF
jgi:hypothetical protein